MVKIIDATDLIVGRLASYAAKLTLMGEKVIIVNSEKAVVSGQRKLVEKQYLERLERGDTFKGPFFPRRADMILRRAVRGMLPWNIERGRKAYKRVMCHLGVPNQYAEQKLETVETASVDKLGTGNYITLAQVSQRLGVKQDN